MTTPVPPSHAEDIRNFERLVLAVAKFIVEYGAEAFSIGVIGRTATEAGDTPATIASIGSYAQLARLYVHCEENLEWAYHGRPLEHATVIGGRVKRMPDMPDDAVR